ncbi:MAG TPA: DUF1801 domain-containing protein [Pyrinomonadaceae bacterium]|jgi:hypothetical protein
MAKSELKTRETEADAHEFINGVADAQARADCRAVARLMTEATGAEPKMWGASIVGFGTRRVKYASGKEQEWMIVGFAPRKANITLYLSTGEAWNEALLAKLGKHKTGMGCLYFKRLADVDENVLKQLIDESVERAGK